MTETLSLQPAIQIGIPPVMEHHELPPCRRFRRRKSPKYTLTRRAEADLDELYENSLELSLRHAKEELLPPSRQSRRSDFRAIARAGMSDGTRSLSAECSSSTS